MLDKLAEIEKAALAALGAAQDGASLETWRHSHLGRNSPLMQVFAGLPGLSKDERPSVGQAANRVKLALEAALADRTAENRRREIEHSLGADKLDVTLPGRPIHRGRLQALFKKNLARGFENRPPALLFLATFSFGCAH